MTDDDSVLRSTIPLQQTTIIRNKKTFNQVDQERLPSISEWFQQNDIAKSSFSSSSTRIQHVDGIHPFHNIHFPPTPPPTTTTTVTVNNNYSDSSQFLNRNRSISNGTTNISLQPQPPQPQQQQLGHALFSVTAAVNNNNNSFTPPSNLSLSHNNLESIASLQHTATTTKFQQNSRGKAPHSRVRSVPSVMVGNPSWKQAASVASTNNTDNTNGVTISTTNVTNKPLLSNNTTPGLFVATSTTNYNNNNSHRHDVNNPACNNIDHIVNHQKSSPQANIIHHVNSNSTNSCNNSINSNTTTNNNNNNGIFQTIAINNSSFQPKSNHPSISFIGSTNNNQQSNPLVPPITPLPITINNSSSSSSINIANAAAEQKSEFVLVIENEESIKQYSERASLHNPNPFNPLSRRISAKEVWNSIAAATQANKIVHNHSPKIKKQNKMSNSIANSSNNNRNRSHSPTTNSMMANSNNISNLTHFNNNNQSLPLTPLSSITIRSRKRSNSSPLVLPFDKLTLEDSPTVNQRQGTTSVVENMDSTTPLHLLGNEFVDFTNGEHESQRKNRGEKVLKFKMINF